MSEDIFDGGTDPQPPADTQTADQLVGEGKQYSSYDELAKGKLNADQFINQLKQELADLRNDLATRDKLKDVLDQLTSRQNLEDDAVNNSDDEFSDTTSSQPAISDDQIEQLIEQKITQKERQRTANQNRGLVLEKAKQVFGSDYARRLEQRADELGLSKDELNELAGRSPKAFEELVLPRDQNARPYSPPASQMNSDALSTSRPNSNPTPGSADYYKKLKKDNPNLYRSPRVQNQLHKDAIKAVQEGRDFDFSGI